MISEDLIEDATLAYIKSYNTAMRETKNPEMAMQIASVVVMTLMQIVKTEKEEINPLVILTQAIQNQRDKKEEVDSLEGDEGSEK